jgi:hypothetical protein
MTTFIVAVEYLGTDLDPHRCTPAAASNNTPTTWPPNPSSTTRNPATFGRDRARASPSTPPARAVPSSHRERRPSAYMKGRVHAHLHPKEHCHAY